MPYKLFYPLNMVNFDTDDYSYFENCSKKIMSFKEGVSLNTFGLFVYLCGIFPNKEFYLKEVLNKVIDDPKETLRSLKRLIILNIVIETEPNLKIIK